MVAVPQPTGILRPSGAPRWGPGACAGSFAFETLYPEDDGPAAREGTAAHYYVTENLQGRNWPVGTLAPNGHPLDADMIEHGALYIDDVREELARFDSSVTIAVEKTLSAHSLVHPESAGTPDTFAVSLVQRRIVLWDYKYGHGFVDAFRNWQLINYVACIFQAYGIMTREAAAEFSVSLRVIQPRNYHRDGPTRQWDTSGDVLWDLVGELRAAAYLAKTPGAPTQTGPHCDDCRARHACEALMKVSQRAIDMAGQTIPLELPPSAVGVELRRIKDALARLEARKDALEEQALSMIRTGTNVPYWTMGFVQSRERWKVSPLEIHLMGDMMGVNLRKDDAVTPAQARKLGVDPAVIAAYSEKPTGAAKLVPSDETAALKAFGK